jgi:hypothetical protein
VRRSSSEARGLDGDGRRVLLPPTWRRVGSSIRSLVFLSGGGVPEERDSGSETASSRGGSVDSSRMRALRSTSRRGARSRVWRDPCCITRPPGLTVRTHLDAGGPPLRGRLVRVWGRGAGLRPVLPMIQAPVAGPGRPGRYRRRISSTELGIPGCGGNVEIVILLNDNGLDCPSAVGGVVWPLRPQGRGRGTRSAREGLCSPGTPRR